MSQIFDLTAEGPVLKQRYENQDVRKGFLEEFPFLADVPKNESAGGGNFNIAVKIATASTSGFTVANALSNGAPDQYKTFAIPNGLYNDYAVYQISGPALDQARGDENALVDLVVEAADGATRTNLISLSNQCFGDGGASRGQISSGQTLSSTTVTFQTPGQAMMFDIGMVLQSAADDGGNGASNLGVKTGSVTVAGVDYQANTVTLTGALSVGIPSVAASDWLFRFGDYGGGFVGLGGWNPVTAPTSSSANFFGVARYTNVQGLAGWRVVGNGANYDDTLADLTARMCSLRATPNRCYMNPIDWASLAKLSNSRVLVDRGKVPSVTTLDLQFEAFKFVHPRGTMDIIADATVPQGVGRVVEMKELSLMSNGKIAREPNDWIKVVLLPAYNDDLYQGRIITRGFLKSTRPASLGVATF